MSCIHDNETILAKKAKLVKMQKYAKKTPKQSPLCSTIHCYCNYIDIHCHFTENWNTSQTASCIQLQPRIETGIVPTKEKTIQNVDLIFHVLQNCWVNKILTITEQHLFYLQPC